MPDQTGWNSTQIKAMANEVSQQADNLARLAPVAPPSPVAFGKLLEPPTINTFPFTTDGVDTWLNNSATSVERIAEGLFYSAESYQAAEDQATGFAQQVGAGAVSCQNGAGTAGTVEVTPRNSWMTAKGVLAEGAAMGGDSFAGGNVGSVLLPSTLEWLNAPIAVTELVTNGLGFLAARLLSHFPPFDRALTRLTGDPNSIREFKTVIETVVKGLQQHVQEMADSTALAPDWFGQAETAYQEYACIEQDCMQAAKALIELLGPSVEGVAANTIQARKMVLAILTKVINEIVRIAAPSLFWLKVAFGVAFIPFGFFISAAIIAGVVANFLARVAELIANELQVIAQLLRDVAQQGAGYLGQIRQLGHNLERAGEVLRTGRDHGSGFGVSSDSTAGSLIGTEADPRDGSILDLLDDATQDFTEVTDPQELAALGLSPEMLVNEGNGFRAWVYRDADGNYVVRFDGTDFLDPQQRDLLQENVPGGVGMGPQSEMAMAIGQAISHSALRDQVVYAGHSLGGRLAAVAALTSGNPAVTANAAGISPAQLEYLAQSSGMSVAELEQQLDGGLVRAYRTSDDPLTRLQERVLGVEGVMPDAVGVQFDLQGRNQGFIDGHSVENVRAGYDQIYGKDRPRTLTPGG